MGYPEAEMDAARKLYNQECKNDYANGYGGDFGCGLEFVMATYAPACWMKFFKRAPGHTP